MADFWEGSTFLPVCGGTGLNTTSVAILRGYYLLFQIRLRRKFDILIVMKLNSAQLTSLSQFFNTTAAAIFTAGAIAPFLTEQADLAKTLNLALISLVVSGILLAISLVVSRRIK